MSRLKILLILFFVCFTAQTSVLQANIKNINIALGIPIHKKEIDNYLIDRPQYVLSYNNKLCAANWVSWHLSEDWFGKSGRYSGAFISDTCLPENFYRVKHSDYTNSGYDRGHLVRSEERTKTKDDNISTFLLTNVIPQTADLNRGVWLKFENFCKELCIKHNKQLIITAGGLYTNNSTNKTIKDKIFIPDSCWKIVLILDKLVAPHNLVEYVTSETEVIAVMMPNVLNIRNEDWEKYLTTVRKIEISTGFDFFTDVPKEIQDIIENNQFENTYKNKTIRKVIKKKK